jgi:hypothetical protein
LLAGCQKNALRARAADERRSTPIENKDSSLSYRCLSAFIGG